MEPQSSSASVDPLDQCCVRASFGPVLCPCFLWASAVSFLWASAVSVLPLGQCCVRTSFGPVLPLGQCNVHASFGPALSPCFLWASASFGSVLCPCFLWASASFGSVLCPCFLWASDMSALPLGQCFRWVSAESVLPCVGGRTAGDVLGFCGPPLTVNAPHVFDLTSPPPSSFANPRPSPLFAQIYVRLDTSFLCTMPGPALRRSDKVCRSHHPLHEL